MLDLYGAANILIAEVRVDRLYPGGPTKAHFVGRFGPDGKVLGRFELIARNSQDLPRIMSEGVQRMDQLFIQAHAAGLVRGDPDLIIQPPPPPEEEVELTQAPAAIQPTVVQVLVIERGDAGAVAQSVAQIRGLAGVVWVTQATLPDGNANLSVNFRGDAGALGAALSSRGWAVTNRGGVLYVTRGAAPPIQRPDPVETSGGPVRAAAGLAARRGRQPPHHFRSQSGRVRAFPLAGACGRSGRQC